MGILSAILIAVSLCADCFAVSMCSGVTLRSVRRSTVNGIALAFAVIQSGLLASGWAFGFLFVGLVEKISHLLAFLLLLYVGGGMLKEGLDALRGRSCDEPRDLNGLRNVALGGIATSIDALAVGVAQSMSGTVWDGFLPLLVSVFAVTFASVVAGIRCGSFLGHRFGHWAEVAGGAVLAAIGIAVLF